MIGLYGDCKSEFSSYFCQQIQLNKNKTFVFYNYLHLTDWVLTHGTWYNNGDTIILNTSSKPFNISFNKQSNSDSVVIYAIDEHGPAPFIDIHINSNFKKSTGFDGKSKLPKKIINKISFSFANKQSDTLLIDELITNSFDTIYVKLDNEMYGKHYLRNEKWVFKNNKLYFSLDKDYILNEDNYFKKTKIRNLKYKEKYYYR